MQAFKKLSSSVIPLWLNDIDTDMIIPAEFLTQTTKDGYGNNLFCRLKEKDSDFVFNNPKYKNSNILVAGDNFGCGSSREHAVWALMQYGIRVVIAPSFSDIFFNNAAKNGLLLISLDSQIVKSICDIAETIDYHIIVDLETQSIATESEEYKFEYDSFRKECLLKGLDDMSYLLSLKDDIKNFELNTKRY